MSLNSAEECRDFSMVINFDPVNLILCVCLKMCIQISILLSQSYF